jgi:hypothetical protein
MSNQAKILELLAAHIIPDDVIRFCIFPYVYENTNKVRKRILRNRTACLAQIRHIEREGNPDDSERYVPTIQEAIENEEFTRVMGYQSDEKPKLTSRRYLKLNGLVGPR